MFYRDKIEDNCSDVDDPGDFIADKIAMYMDVSVEKYCLGKHEYLLAVVASQSLNPSLLRGSYSIEFAFNNCDGNISGTNSSAQ